MFRKILTDNYYVRRGTAPLEQELVFLVMSILGGKHKCVFNVVRLTKSISKQSSALYLQNDGDCKPSGDSGPVFLRHGAWRRPPDRGGGLGRSMRESNRLWINMIKLDWD